MFSNLWHDCDGGVITTELVLVASVTTATLLTGLSSFRNHIESEFQHLGQTLHHASTQGVASQPKAAVNVQADPQALAGTIFAGDLNAFLTE